MSAASENLRNNQKQADMDGCMVQVSRQAVDEVLAEYDRMRALLARGRRWISNAPGSDAKDCTAKIDEILKD